MNINSYYFTNDELIVCYDSLPDGADLVASIRLPLTNELFHVAFVTGKELPDNKFSFNLGEIGKYLEFNKNTVIDFLTVDRKSNERHGVTYVEKNKSPLIYDTYCFEYIQLQIKLSLDKNKRFALFVTKKQKKSVTATFVIDKQSFVFENVTAEGTVFLARRSFKLRNERYDCFIPLPKGKEIKVSELLSLLDGYIQNAKEIWDLVLKADGSILCFECQPFDFNYQKVNDAFNAKPFISEEKFLSVFTGEGKNEEQNKIKVAVIGTCYTKQPFHSIDYMNPDYKRFYENNCIIFHTTFASMMSNKFEIDSDDLIGAKDQALINLYGRQEFDKEAIQKIVDYKPDYIVIDLFTESRQRIYKIDDNTYVTDSFFLEGCKVLDKLKDYPTIKVDDYSREVVFSESVRKFKDVISKVLPLSHIILLRVNSATKFKNKQGVICDFANPNWLHASDTIWQRYNDLFTQAIPECRVIELRQNNYIGDETNPLGLSSNLLVSEFYKSVLNQMNKIVLQDLIKERK